MREETTKTTPEGDERGTGAATLARLLAPEARGLARAGRLSALSGALWTGQAALVAWLIGRLLAGEGAAGAGPVAAGFVAIAALRAGLTYIAEGMAHRAGDRIVAQLRRRIARTEARVTEAGHGLGPGALAALASEKLDMLLPYVTRFAPARARVGLIPPLILILAFWQSWAVGLVFLVTGPLIPVFQALVGMAAEEASRRQMREIATMNDLLVERLSALTDIRLLDAGARVTRGFYGAADDLRGRTMAVLRVAFLSSTVLELFAAIGIAMVAVFTGFTLLGVIGWGSWGGAMSPAAGIFLLLLAPEYYQPLRDLSAAWHDRAAASAVAADIAAWEDAPKAEIIGTGDAAPALDGPARIAVAGLVVARGSRHIAFPQIEIEPGESVALLAPSGSGKTTLLRALAGLETPVAGTIEVAGRVLDGETADGWRARLGWMPQAPRFLSGSLAHNVRMGQGGDIGPALHRAALDDVIARLPRGAATRLGETGAGLSGGEARRVTLARALHAAPDVLLADEPTADLDAGTAARITEALLALAADGATVIVATHDLDLAARMDRTIRLDGVEVPA